MMGGFQSYLSRSCLSWGITGMVNGFCALFSVFCLKSCNTGIPSICVSIFLSIRERSQYDKPVKHCIRNKSLTRASFSDAKLCVRIRSISSAVQKDGGLSYLSYFIFFRHLKLVSVAPALFLRFKHQILRPSCYVTGKHAGRQHGDLEVPYPVFVPFVG